MPETPARRADHRVTLRARASLVGALLCGFALLVLAVWRHEFDTGLLVLALTAVTVSAIRSRSGPEAPAAPPAPGPAGSAQDVLSAFPDPVVVVDERATVLDVNAAALALAPGLSAGRPLSLALRSPRILEAIPRVIATGLAEEAEFGGRVATEATFAVRLSPIGRSGADQRAALLLFRDLTAQRRNETMRVDFVANVSHELRTPLSTILGFIETLQGAARKDAPARERFLEMMRGQAFRMSRLIDDLLQLSRLELNVHVAPSASVELTFLLRQLLESMAPLARQQGVAIEFDPPPGPIEVVGDQDELLRLAENLLANAIKYGAGGGPVLVRLEPSAEGRTIELSVRDHGPGIAPEHLPRLTERFYRVDVAESRAQGGTGLGLAIVKHIVTRHRGRLFIESEPGRGALFRVQLPRAGSDAPDPGPDLR